jgi:hypothetical protein
MVLKAASDKGLRPAGKSKKWSFQGRSDGNRQG